MRKDCREKTSMQGDLSCRRRFLKSDVPVCVSMSASFGCVGVFVLVRVSVFSVSLSSLSCVPVSTSS